MATSTAAAWAGASAALRSLRSLGADIRDARAQAARHRPRPPGTGLVVEVGGGQRPSARADVVVDKYVEDDFERAGGAPLDTSRPLVVADGEALPFDDGSAAYVIAMHVLEHATDPVRFAAELSRVGQAGFVQVPSRAAELTVGCNKGVDDTSLITKIAIDPESGAHGMRNNFVKLVKAS